MINQKSRSWLQKLAIGKNGFNARRSISLLGGVVCHVVKEGSKTRNVSQNYRALEPKTERPRPDYYLANRNLETVCEELDRCPYSI